MKRYLAFIFYHYYPWGGMNDLAGIFDEQEEAISAVKTKVGEENFNVHAHIFDTKENKIVWQLQEEDAEQGRNEDYIIN